MDKTGKLVGINLLLLLIYGAIIMGIFAAGSDPYAGVGFGMFMMIAIGIQALVLLIIGIVLLVQKKKDRGRAFLLSMFIVLLVGFSACFGGMSAFDGKMF